jgi:hypothetical protein
MPLHKYRVIGGIEMENQDESQNASNPFIDQILKSGMGKIVEWFSFLIPPLLLYWLATIYSASSIYNIYEVYSLCGVCWLIYIIEVVLLITIILVIILSRILLFIKRPLTKDAFLVRLALFAAKIRGPLANILWCFMIVFGYSLIYAYAPLRPIIMKAYSALSLINFIDYYQLTYLCNSYVSLAIDFVMK